jgi:hypothetical protein
MFQDATLINLHRSNDRQSLTMNVRIMTYTMKDPCWIILRTKIKEEDTGLGRNSKMQQRQYFSRQRIKIAISTIPDSNLKLRQTYHPPSAIRDQRLPVCCKMAKTQPHPVETSRFYPQAIFVAVLNRWGAKIRQPT